MSEWAQAHRAGCAIIINITRPTDSPFDGASLDEWAERLTGIATQDGQALLFNIFLAPEPNLVMLPATDAGLPSPGPDLFRISSVLPPPMVLSAQNAGITPPSGARGFAFNADSTMLVKFLEIGTRWRCATARGAGTVMQVQLIIFSAPKDGCSPADWEDGAGGGPFGRGHSGDPACARFAVADGATETYDSGRWADQLIASFISPEQANGAGYPDLERDAMSAWFKAMQDHWQVDTPATSDYIEQLKIRQGTLATFVGGQLTGLDGGKPAWHAAALGDAVLFHVRDRRLITHLPALGSCDFDSTPEGISTLPGRLNRMSGQLKFQRGSLAPQDMIFVATDAFAKWMITAWNAATTCCGRC
jgi:hypothetical protein